MNIGFDARWFNSTGVGSYVHNLLEAIIEIDDSRINLVVYEDPANPLPDICGPRVRKEVLFSKKYSSREQFELMRVCRAHSIDVFHAPFYVAPWFASCAVVVTIHDLIPFLFDAYPFPKRQAIQIGHWGAALRASIVIANSNRTAADVTTILKVSPGRIRTVYLAASGKYFHDTPSSGERDYLAERFGIHAPYMLTLSASNWKTKNLPLVLKAAHHCRLKVPFDFQVVIPGPPIGYLQAREVIGIDSDNVVIPGYVDTCDLAKLYRNASMFVMASRYEGFGLPLLEAMSCGCPVISSTEGSLPEVAGPGALLVAPDDLLSLEHAITELFCDSEQRENQRRRSRRRAADFSWRRCAEETLKVYFEAARA
jgi:glycosyltransferase involved in cell wall biosynthesis